MADEVAGSKKRSFTDLASSTDGAHDSPSGIGSPSNSQYSNNAHTKGHFRTRPIRSCNACRQQKIKCNLQETYPDPCQRCEKMNRECVINPDFKPQKGGQVASLRDDLSTLRRQVEYLQQRESLLASAVAKTNPNSSLLTGTPVAAVSPAASASPPGNGAIRTASASTPGSASQIASTALSTMVSSASDSNLSRYDQHRSRQDYISPSEYMVGEVRLPSERAEELHKKFMTDFLPYMPIIQSNSAAELYNQSELLFWVVCLTASLCEPEPTLYNSLSGIIKQLAIETCWIRTPRSTHIVQALIILGTWPLPNEKVLDDSSYRFIGIAKSLAMQLGLHRGKFIYEFSRTQTSLPDAEKWRTRTWLALFLSEQVWSANLGLPPTVPIDYLVDTAQTDQSLPASFRSLVRLAAFYSRLVNFMGTSITSPDGLLDGKNRPNTLMIMEQQLNEMEKTLVMNEPSVEIYFLYIKLMICCFAFLPGMQDQDQANYVVTAFHAGTRVVTLISKLSEKRQLIEYPIYMRQAVSFAAFILFRIHLSPMLMQQHVESARQSVVTVHRLFRNMLTAWKDVENDISRTAKVLEKLNFVIITHPYLFTQAPNIITRMRSHLTASIFYELIWAVHEARRRGTSNSSGDDAGDGTKKESSSSENDVPQPLRGPKPPAFAHLETVPPLPFYNQITKDDFSTNTTVTPNGTTVTTLVPTHPNATLQVFGNSVTNGTNNDPSTSPTTVQVLPPDMKSSNQHSSLRSHPVQQAPLTGTTSVSSESTAPLYWTAPASASASSGAAMAQQPAQPGMAALLDSTGASNDPLHLDTLMQGIDWMNDKGDDFLGWMDVNVAPF